jgi:hypothetical protein
MPYKIYNDIETIDDETKWAALNIMIGTTSSVVALTKNMEKPEYTLKVCDLQLMIASLTR